MRKISLACRSSRFSRSRAFILAVMSVDAPGRLPASTSALFTQSLSVCPVQPILGAIDRIVAQRDGCSCSCSRTRRTARLRTSGDRRLAHGGSTFSGVGASGKPGAVHTALLKVIMRLRASRPRECLLGVSAPDARPLGLCYAAPATKLCNIDQTNGRLRRHLSPLRRLPSLDFTVCVQNCTDLVSARDVAQFRFPGALGLVFDFPWLCRRRHDIPRSHLAGIGRRRQKCPSSLWARQTFSRRNSLARTETGSNVGRDRFESRCAPSAPPFCGAPTSSSGSRAILTAMPRASSFVSTFACRASSSLSRE